jgi:hypothetical protein
MVWIVFFKQYHLFKAHLIKIENFLQNFSSLSRPLFSIGFFMLELDFFNILKKNNLIPIIKRLKISIELKYFKPFDNSYVYFFLINDSENDCIIYMSNPYLSINEMVNNELFSLIKNNLKYEYHLNGKNVVVWLKE